MIRALSYVAGGLAIGAAASSIDEPAGAPVLAGNAATAVAGGSAIVIGARLVARGESLALMRSSMFGRGAVATGAGMLVASAIGTVVDGVRERAVGGEVRMLEREIAGAARTTGGAERLVRESQPSRGDVPAGHLDVAGVSAAHAARVLVARYDRNGDDVVDAHEAQVTVDGHMMSMSRLVGSFASVEDIRERVADAAGSHPEDVLDESTALALATGDRPLELDVTWDATEFVAAITRDGELPGGQRLRPWSDEFPLFLIPDDGVEPPRSVASFLADAADVAVLRLPAGAPTRFGAMRIGGPLLTRAEASRFDQFPEPVVGVETIDWSTVRAGAHDWLESIV